MRFVENQILENEVVLFSYPEPFAPYRWYETQPELSYGATDSINASPSKTDLLTKNILKRNVTGIYYFEYLRDLSDSSYSVLSVIFDEGFTERSRTGDFNSVGHIIYFRR